MDVKSTNSYRHYITQNTNISKVEKNMRLALSGIRKCMMRLSKNAILERKMSH